MKSIYDCIVFLLGKPRSESGGCLLELVEVLNENPVVDCDNENVWFYTFKNSGVKLTFNAKDGIFEHAVLCFATPEVQKNVLKGYQGDLPFGISNADSIKLVESKFPGSTSSVKDYSSDLDLRPLVVLFSFDDSKGAIEMVSIDYLY